MSGNLLADLLFIDFSGDSHSLNLCDNYSKKHVYIFGKSIKNVTIERFYLDMSTRILFVF